MEARFNLSMARQEPPARNRNGLATCPTYEGRSKDPSSTAYITPRDDLTTVSFHGCSAQSRMNPPVTALGSSDLSMGEVPL
jgi:hypothetical protein